MFGASRPAFGQAGSSPFGQQNQQAGNAFGQQPSAPTNSLFGTNSASNAQSGFGGFGTASNNTNAAQAMNSPFGMSQQQASTTSPFGGATANPLSNPPSLFGGSQSSGTISGTGTSGPLSGTGIKPFQPYTEKDVSTGNPCIFQAITCMPEYKSFSFEELRFQDYQQNRKFSTTAGGPTTNSIASPFGQQANGTNNTFGLGNKNTMGAGGSTFGQVSSSSFGQQQPGTAFGQPTTSPFGQQQTQPQQGGLFGQQNATNSPFGQATTNTSPFGINKPATAGGLFGQSTNTVAPFGQANNSPFGQQNQQQQGNAFGQSQPGTTFGGGFGQQNNNQPSTGLFGQTSATNGGSMFGQQNNTASTFGAQNNSTTGGLFGAKPATNTGGLFGQTAQQPQQGGLFGQTNNSPFGQNNNNNANNSPFGQQSQSQGGGLFGQNNNNPTGGLFGQQNNANPATTGTGLFGQPSNTMNQQSGGLFGSKPPATAGGLFGQNSQQQPQPQQPSSGGLFGQQNNNTVGGGLFGQNSQQQNSSGLFGQGNQQQQPNSGGLFGQNNQQQQQSGGGLFGQQNNANTNTGGGLFGAKPAGPTPGGLFGQNNQQQNTTGGLFGQNNQQSTNGGLFGQNMQQQNANTGGLFGAKPAGSTTTGGLFGNNTAQNNNSQGGLFGAKPLGGTSNTTGGLFGAKPTNGMGTTTTSGLFGAKPNGGTTFGAPTTNAAPTLGGGLFGNKPATSTTGGLFGGQNASTGGVTTGNMFGSSNLQPGQQSQGQQQGMQQNSNPYGTEELFSRVISIPNSITQPNKPSATKVSADLKKKNSLSSAYKLVPKPLFDTKSSTDNSLKFKISLKLARDKDEGSSPSTAIAKRTEDSTSIFDDATDEAILKTGNMLFNPDRKSFKNLIINRQTMEKKDSAPNELKFITFNENTESPKKSEQKENTDIFNKKPETPSNNPNKASSDIDRTPNIDESNSNKFNSGKLMGEDISFTENGYYISPSFETLESLSLMEVRKVKNLVVGHKDFGKIEFLKPVDLSLIPLPSICGKLILFESRCCTVSYIGDKPEKGQGLNVTARITLNGCYPKDKATGLPIKDSHHPVLKKHIENLKSMKEERFDSYDPEIGSWSFITEEPVV